jgi:Uma2 family endonuclease
MISCVEEPMTLQEFLRSKFFQEGWELYKGELVAMSPVRKFHEYTVHRLSYLFQTIFDKAGCDCTVYGSNVRVEIKADDSFVMPDLSIDCSGTFEDGAFETVPDFVMEVLSKSTRKYDLGQKFELYRQFGAKEYWVLDIDARSVTIFDFANGTNRVFINTETVESKLFPYFDCTVSEIYGRLSYTGER